MLERRVDLELGVVGPVQLAGLRVEGVQLLMLRAEIKCVRHLDRSDLKGRLARVILAGLVAGPECPGDLQLFDVSRRDLRQRRVTLAKLGAAVRVNPGNIRDVEWKM